MCSFDNVLNNVDTYLRDEEIGHILSVKDGVAFVAGLPNVRVGEMIEFIDKNIFGMALNLEGDRIGCIIFGDDQNIMQNDNVLH
jgi:F-type H+-transporting ATPase subunit alpha